MGDFSLSDATQQYSFPVQIAQQMDTDFPQTLIQPPGIGDVPGFIPSPVIVPLALQSTVLDQIPPDPPCNLSVPGFTLADALRMRPREPLIDRTSSKQTVTNLVLGLRQIAYGASSPLPTQLELAIGQKPTIALVELGYVEALEAATAGNPQLLPDPSAFRNDYSQIVRNLRATGAEVVVLTIPDPFDTAYFSTLHAAASLVKVDVDLLREFWGIQADDLITVNGLNEISYQVYAASIGPASGEAITRLGPRTCLSAAAVCALRRGIQELNREITAIAAAERVLLYDLAAFIKRIHEHGARAGAQAISGDYLGGFYSLNGYYPGATGQALLANEILGLLNRKFGASFPLVDVARIAANDPVAAYKTPTGPNWTRQQLISPSPLPLPPAQPVTGPLPPPQKASSQEIETRSRSLQLPPGLEQVLPLNPELSYFGDALSAQNCRTPATIQWGSGGNLYFRGLAMMDSHLSGNIRIRFTPPVSNWTTFQISFEKGLAGSDAYLAAPVFFSMPGKQQLVGDVPGVTSSGRLNLETGQVDPTPGTFNLFAAFFNSALFALLKVNPNFPATPLSFPGQYGSATAKFEQRPDGKLDFTFLGTTFVPLGQNTAFPLNFCGPSREFASIPANGTVLHPRLALSTKLSQTSVRPVEAPQIPVNTVQEFTLFSPASSFGDYFTLHAPELGGTALGRSRLLGRVQIQFGPPSRNSVPFAVSTTTSGGMLAPLGATPLAQLFPGRLTPGPQGLYEILRFPFRTYSLNDLAVIDDPFDLSVGALDLNTGESLHPLLHRGFINQDLLFALLRVEPRTPQNSFYFRGPAQLKKGAASGQVFSSFGQVHIPYPPGFLFPDPNLATGFPVVGGGSLDPYLWMWGIRSGPHPEAVESGEGTRMVSSRGEIYSFRFGVALHRSETAAPFFEFENHTQQGSFRMHSLAWVDFGNSSGSQGIDTVTFCGFGVWKKNGAELVTQAAAQFFNSTQAGYVGIQIGPGGEISNVNTLTPATAFAVPIEIASLAKPATPARQAASDNNLQAATNRRGPMYSHIIELTAKPGQGRELVDVIRDRAIPEIIRPSRGFIDEIVLLSETDPNHVTAISFWQSQEDGTLFLQNGFAKVSALTQPYLMAKPERQEFIVGASTNNHIAGWP
ncbi:MAG TPA: antibiotic biosynthesis monooxygenase [Candidatus Angelobacter sp.]|nr:antibiotic biosynthesis monooxygenase [Candidatus Angelobacter sp.]